MRRINLILSIPCLVLFALGCASNTERHWGESVQANTEAQIANPVAELRNADKGVGALDGTSADNAVSGLRQRESGKSAGRELPDYIQIGTGSN